MTTADDNKKIHETAHKIASELAGWSYDATRGRSKDDGELWPAAFLICQEERSPFDGFRICIIKEWNSPKLEIALSFDREDHNLYLKEDRPKIGCSSTKAPARIAMDITRRLYPKMTAAVKEIRNRRSARDKHQNGLARTREAMLKSPHVEEWGCDHDHGGKGLRMTTTASDFGHDIKIHSDGTVTLSLSDVTPAQARKILAMLNRKGA